MYDESSFVQVCKYCHLCAIAVTHHAQDDDPGGKRHLRHYCTILLVIKCTKPSGTTVTVIHLIFWFTVVLYTGTQYINHIRKTCSTPINFEGFQIKSCQQEQSFGH